MGLGFTVCTNISVYQMGHKTQIYGGGGTCLLWALKVYPGLSSHLETYLNFHISKIWFDTLRSS